MFHTHTVTALTGVSYLGSLEGTTSMNYESDYSMSWDLDRTSLFTGACWFKIRTVSYVVGHEIFSTFNGVQLLMLNVSAILHQFWN